MISTILIAIGSAGIGFILGIEFLKESYKIMEQQRNAWRDIAKRSVEAGSQLHRDLEIIIKNQN